MYLLLDSFFFLLFFLKKNPSFLTDQTGRKMRQVNLTAHTVYNSVIHKHITLPEDFRGNYCTIQRGSYKKGREE